MPMNYKIQLQGLHCDACKKILQKRLGRLEGVTFVDVNLDQQTVLLTSSNALEQVNIKEALKDTEYKVAALIEI